MKIALSTTLTAAAALALALSVVAMNGRPLLYFDSASYLDQGARFIGLAPPAAVSDPVPAAAPEAPVVADAEASADPTPKPPAKDDTVSGNRSFVFALFVAVIFASAGLPGIVAANLAAIGLSAWIFARSVARAGDPPSRTARTAATGCLFGCLGSLPFYVAFVMPDIFAPCLVLLVAALFSAPQRLSFAEKTAAVLLALFSVVVHPSHLLLVAALVPVALFLSPLADGRRLAFGLVIAGLLVGVGVAERLAFRAAVERILHRQVVELPFLTARLIDDGPGLAYLSRRCPDDTYPTCALFAALGLSDDPARLDAPNILFAQSAHRGSYKLLDPAVATAVATDQIRFARDVTADDPAGVLGAIARNVLVQLSYFSVEMTAPTVETAAAVGNLTTYLPPGAGSGRLLAGFPPVRQTLYALHGVVYAASAIALVGFLLARRLPPPQRAAVLIVLAGIILNAVFCGAVSEPAHRYGARMMFLLPMVAAMLVATRRAQVAAQRPPGGDRRLRG
ncbi:MAG: hypothetical protein ACKVPY_14140 [Paracoccaceae bacterium]